jgi:hypothetical protein
MGGIVSHPRPPPPIKQEKDADSTTERPTTESSLIPSHYLSDGVPLTLADIPLMQFEEISKLLPICISSWNHVVQSTVDGQVMLGNLFQLKVYDSLRDLKGDAGAQIEMLLRDSKKKRAINPVTYVMRYCIRTRRQNDSQFKKKLSVLGREHMRIGVTSELLTVFCETLLKAFASCFDNSSTSHAMIFAWMANMKYILSSMTATRFQFIRTLSGNGYCEKCGCVCAVQGLGYCEVCSSKGAFGFTSDSIHDRSGTTASSDGAGKMFDEMFCIPDMSL